MDTSFEYIEMCNKSSQIQNLKMQLLENGKLYESIENTGGNVFYESIWLPKQDQLQKICKIDRVLDSKESLIYFLRNFRITIDIYNMFFDSFEKIWLHYTMKEVYDNAWNVDLKKWENISELELSEYNKNKI